jgi:hypothetical protein
MGSNQNGKCGCVHHYVSPVLVILIALFILLGNLNVVAWETVSIVWPVLLGLLGFQRLFERNCRCCNGCGCECGSDKNAQG